MSRLSRHRAAIARQDTAHTVNCDTYSEIRAKWKAWNKKHYSGKPGSKRKKPWYIITSGKQYNYEERQMSWGAYTNYFRVLSEAGIYNKAKSRMTKQLYQDLLIEAKAKDWVAKHPRPVPYDSLQKDLFEAEFMLPWIDEYTKQREKIAEFVKNIGSKVYLYARYQGDVGYPHLITTFKSDHSDLMINGGYYTNPKSKTVRKAKLVIDCSAKVRKDLIAVMIVDGDQRCIIPR